MIKFTDPNLYVMGTCMMQFADTQTGDIKFWTNKVSNFSDTSNANEVLIRAGLTNGIAAIMTTDSEKTITATAANFSLQAKAMQLGATLSYNGVAPVCEVVTATGAALSINMVAGTPVANYGYSDVKCYVQEVGADSPIATFGTAYGLNPATGAITGFSATSGKQYKVWYFVNKAEALQATIYDAFQPGVYHATAQLAVYRNMTGASTNSGTRVGWLYAIYPRYKLNVGGGLVGDQTTADTTDLSGRALPQDADIISANCSDCETGVTAYYLYVPDEGGSAVSGILAAIGNVITVPQGGTAQVTPKFIMENGQLVTATDLSGFTFALDGLSGTTVSASGVITAGTTSGTGTLTVTYTDGTDTYDDTCSVVVPA